MKFLLNFLTSKFLLAVILCWMVALGGIGRVHVSLPRLVGESSEARIKSGFHPHHLEDVQAPQL